MFVKRAIKEVILVLILSVIGFLLLASSYCLPIERISSNIKYSRHTFSHENGYEEISYSNSKLDNFTDGLMILEAGYDGDESIFVKASNSSYRGVFPLTPNESLVEIYKNGNEDIDNMYNTAKLGGAMGGKILGAGGGGFMLIYVKPENHERVREVMKEYKEVKFDIDSEGSRIIFVD